MASKAQHSFLTLEKHGDVGVIWMDLPGEEWNKISIDTEAQFREVMQQIEADTGLKASVLISRKKGFMAGADIEKFLKMKPGESKATAQAGHAMLRDLEDSKKPCVAAIHGACMGGGLEISLACAGRVASNHSSTIMALPEVKLGLLPGLGGTYRLPKLVGVQNALSMILTGRNVYAFPALKMGLVDELVYQPKLLDAAVKFARKLATGQYRRKSKMPLASKVLESNPLTRGIIFSQATKMMLRQTSGNYPAPYKILESVKYGLSHTRAQAAEKETELFDQLLQSPEAFQLINIFFAMNALRKNPMKALARPVKTLGVLGAGLMGEGIAEVTVQNGTDILLKDLQEPALAQAKKNIWAVLIKKMKTRAITKADAETIINKVHTTTTYEGFHKADVIIEAVFEDINIKHKVLKETEAAIRKDCVFASNTSALPITKIAEASSRPETVIGMHYFSPVPKMPLLEIVVTGKTADWVTATALEVGVKQGKTCIVVKDGPGFYTTRILAPFINEALLLMQEGADPLQMDKAMKKFGFPVGPITLIDEVGIDVGAHINKGDLEAFFNKRGAKSSDLLNKLAEAGFKGRKNRKGFLQYDEKTGKKLRGKVNEEALRFFESRGNKAFKDSEIQERLSLIMINEAIYCLQEGILKEPRDGDIGAVFGLGFPPFLGGPFRYVDVKGAKTIVEKMTQLEKEIGARFKPAGMLVEQAEKGKTFY
ncbi:MAG: 3-hydroxyacyl-CoA dehydrogenase NAD-binding domain-containing protein [Imperialibacter sp.]